MLKHFTVHILSLFIGACAFGQNPSITFSPDSNFFKNISSSVLQIPFDYLYHSPQDEDHEIYKKYSYLLYQQPTIKNHKDYYSLACSLWELNKLKDAEKMFLTILNSHQKYYSDIYYHSSDIPGDTMINTYGYGSYTSSYKNSASIYLTQIYIEQGKFEKAYQYLQAATKKYKVVFTCGTGLRGQQDKYNFLYACCYEGLKQYNKVVDLLLPDCLNRNDQIIIRAIKKIYSPQAIRKDLIKAENSMVCLFDSLPSVSYRTTYSSDGATAIRDSLTYYSGSAKIYLFGKTIDLPSPYLENGEHATREYFIKLFKETQFYGELAEASGITLK